MASGTCAVIARRVVGPILALAIVCAFGLGCASAYQSTYDRTYQQLDQQSEAERAQQEALHAEAQKYVAIVYFATGSSVIDQAGYDEVDWFVKKMQSYPQAILEVRGFTDSTGSEGINQELSDARADAVSSALEMGGIASSRIKKMGYGSNFQAAPNTTVQGRRNNRRVEVTVQ